MIDPKNFRLYKKIELAIYRLIKKSTTTVCKNTVEKLNEFKQNEQNNPIILSQLRLILENIEYGHENEIPICQDTGHVNFFIKLGDSFPIISNFKNMILTQLKKLTEESILRPNTVDPISQENEGFNAGINTPPIYLEIEPNSFDLILTVLNKGGGSENMSALFMMSAANGKDKIVEKIVESMDKAGGKPCPPTILGIGIGGDSVKAMYFAKKALLRPLGAKNHRDDLAQLEEKILKEVNDLDIGVMGLGGHSNCLDVRIEASMRHPATYPVGLVVECYCHRTLSCKITKNGEVLFGRLNNDFKFENYNFAINKYEEDQS